MLKKNNDGSVFSLLKQHEGLLLRPTLLGVGNIAVMEKVEERRLPASKAVADVARYLGVNSLAFRMAPAIYTEYQPGTEDDPRYRERPGFGALIVKCTMRGTKEVRNIRIDEDNRPLPESTITFLGMFAEERREYGVSEDYIHTQHPVAEAQAPTLRIVA